MGDVRVTRARNEVPVPLALRLFLPAVWTGDAARLRRTGEAEAMPLIRRLVEKIEIRPAGAGHPPGLTLYGRLAELLSPRFVPRGRG